MSPSEQMEKQGTVSILHAQELRAEGRPLSMRSVFQVPLQTGIAERAIWTVGRHMASTKVVLEENVLEGHDVGPRLTA